VKNVTERYVDTSAQILDLLGEGKRNRSVAVTGEIEDTFGCISNAFSYFCQGLNMVKSPTNPCFMRD
jgi:hypothetical protein